MKLFSYPQAGKISVLGCIVTLLPACTALDKQYHTHFDSPQQEDAPIAMVQADESSLTASADAHAPVDGIMLIPDEQADHTDNEEDEISAQPGKSMDWQYHADSRDRELAEQREDSEVQSRQWQDPLTTGYQPNRTHKALNDYAGQLAMVLMASTTLSSNERVGVASFVRLNRSLQEPTVMGNQLAELLIAQLQDFGVSVVDFKTSDGLRVTPDGDLAMTRSGETLSRQMTMDHILTGTLIEEPRGVRVNARIVSVSSGEVVGSATLLVPAFMVAQLNKIPQA